MSGSLREIKLFETLDTIGEYSEPARQCIIKAIAGNIQAKQSLLAALYNTKKEEILDMLDDRFNISPLFESDLQWEDLKNAFDD